MQTIAYNVFDASACAFPSPRVALLPSLVPTALVRPRESRFETIGAGRPLRHYTRGRYALHEACRLAGVGPAGALLAPAYHCRTMLDPAIRLDGEVVLYELDEHLRPSRASLKAALAAAQRPVRALLLTHYFGFAQDAAAVRTLCDEFGIALIEDCSHALFDRRGAGRLGRAGRYVTASPYKMLPCEEGGWLLGEAHEALPDVRRPDLRSELRTLVHAAEHAWARLRTPLRRAGSPSPDADVAGIMTTTMARGDDARRVSSMPSAQYNAAEEGLGATWTSRTLMASCDVDHAAECRRANYGRWHDALSKVALGRPLFDRLPGDCVPYMFPLLIDRPDDHFHVLKRLGVPIWRWDDMADSACPVSQHYRRHLLHLPCHQALAVGEMDWMIRTVDTVLRLPGPTPRTT